MNLPLKSLWHARKCALLGPRLIPVALSVGLTCLPRPATATPPGQVLYPNANLPPTHGQAWSSRVADDGSVMLRGDISHVDGSARPGLALLKPSGELDPAFLPEIVSLPNAGMALPWPFSMATPVSSIFALQDGTWLHTSAGYPLAYQPTGRENRRYDFLRNPHGWAGALFETGGVLFLARHLNDGPRLEAVHAGTLMPIPLPGQDDWPAPFEHAVPAGPDHLWVLGRVRDGLFYDYVFNLPTRWLFRVDLSGNLDPDFEPIQLPSRFAHQLAPRAGGGYRTLRRDTSRLQLWPSPTMQTYFVDLHDADGQLLVTRRIDVPLGFGFLLDEAADGALVHNTLEWYNDRERMILVRILPDGSYDSDFRVPMHAYSLQVLADGRIQHSHTHRILPDGSPDPSWQIPRLAASPDVRVTGAFEDGSLVATVAGGFLDATPHLFALGPDRQLDPSFQPPPDLPPALSYHIARNGQSLVLALRGIHEFPDGTKTRILRLLRDGSIDPASPRYLPEDNTFRIDPDLGTFTPGVHRGGFALYPLSGGGFLVHYHIHPSEVPIRRVLRLRPDGTPDPGFAFSGAAGWVDAFLVLSDDRFIHRNNLHAADGSLQQTLAFPSSFGSAMAEGFGGVIAVRYYDEDDAHQLALFHLEDGVNPSFETRFMDGTRIHQVLPLVDGQWIVEGNLRTPVGPRTLLRLRADGRIDPAFRPPPLLRVPPRSRGWRTVVRDGIRYPATFANRSQEVRAGSLFYDADDDALLVGGAFTHVGLRPRRGFAWLSLRRVHRFAEWLSLFPSEGGDDSDMPPLAAYALGVDPADPDAEGGWRAVPGEPLRIRLPINPDAVDIVFDLEVSEDLTHWRAPHDGELAVMHLPSEIRVRLEEGADTLFVRLHYRVWP